MLYRPIPSRSACRVNRRALSLIEVTAALTLVALAAAVTVPALKRPGDVTKKAACALQHRRLEAEAWNFRRRHGRWPKDMAELTADPKQFPNGPLMCPLTGQSYEWSDNSESVHEHVHDP